MTKNKVISISKAKHNDVNAFLNKNVTCSVVMYGHKVVIAVSKDLNTASAVLSIESLFAFDKK